MADTKVDLMKLREEISERRQGHNTVPARLGKAVGTSGGAPRDEFLNGLIHSLDTGKVTPSVNVIKEVENKTAEKNGEKARIPISTAVKPPLQSGPSVIGESPDREELMYSKFNSKGTLAESIAQFTKANGIQQPTNNFNMLNESAINEGIKNVVTGYLAENLAGVLDESTRSTIVEIYSAEKLKNVLMENREWLKELVYEVIREIQAKSKK